MAHLPPCFVTALLLAAAMGVSSQTTTELFELHGSGSNVATGPLRKALDLFMSRAKPAVVVSYRSIGTNNAQVEFLAATPNATVPDFATGNMPLPSATYQQLVNASATPLQIPLLFGTVSFFYNVPGVSQLNLSACTLAKIYTGAITSWTDPDIVLQNPLLAAVVPPGTNITSWKRSQASSGNMLAASTYFDAACPSVWTYGVGTDATNWPVISNSQGAYTTTALLSGIKDTPYTIGFEDSGDGLTAGLSEVQITNLANTTLTSTQADPVQVANAYDAVNITALDSDWSNVTFLDTPTNLSWPMTVALYIQVRKDSSFLGRNSGLLQALITFLLSDDVQSLWTEGYYVPLSASMRATLTAAVPSFLTVNTSSPTWKFENMTAQPGAGQADYVISGLRNTYATSTLYSLETRAASLESVAALGNEYQVHVAGSWYPSLYLQLVQNDLMSMSRLPIDLTYRVVGTYQAQSEFKSPTNMFQQQNHIKVGDLPLSSADYATLTATPLLKGVLQVPIAVGGISIYFNAPAFQYNPDGSTRVQLTACDVAGIFSGVFTNWNQISSLQSSAYSYPITPVAFGVDASQTYVLTRYMATGCPMLWRQGYNGTAAWPATAKTTVFGKTILQSWEMMVAISSTPYSIGYVESSLDALEARYGYLPHLYEAPIQVRNGSYVIASQVDFSAVATQMFASTTVPRDAVGLPDLTADWSSVNPVGADAWPLSYITYAYVYQNLTLYGPSGPLIKSMLTYIFDDDPTNSAASYGVTPIPKDLRVAFTSKIQTSLVVAPFQPEWAIEDRWTLGPGYGLYTFSRHRSNFLTTAAAIQDMEMRLVQGRISAALPKLGRLLGVIEFSNLTGRMLTDVMGMAASPVRLTYETAATSQAAVDIFVGAGNGYKGYHDMLLLDQPLPADAYATLKQNNVQVVQAPVFVHAVALYYNGSGSAGLLRNLRPSINMSACTLARAWNGSLKWWNDNSLLAENDYYKNTMLKLPFQLAYAQSESYKLTAVRRYIMTGCNTTVPPLPVGAQVFATQDQLAAAIQMQPLFLMGIMSRLYGNPYNLTIVKLKSQYKYKGVVQYVEPSKPPPGVNISNTYLIQPMLDATLPKPTDDWSNFSLVWTDTMGKGYYPIMSSAFVIMRADLTFSNESGGLVKGLLAYMLGPWQQQLADTAYSGRLPGGTGMAVPTPAPTANVSLILKDQQATAALRMSLQNQVLPQIQTAQNVQQWPLAQSRSQIDGIPNAIITNLWKPADYSDAQLQASDVTARLLANQLAVLKNAIATQKATEDQLAKVQSIAIAGVVISVLLSFLAVLLGACWFRKNKRTVQDIIDKLNSHPAMYGTNGNGTASERTGLMAA